MDNIVADNGYAIGSIGHLNLLYVLAQERGERERHSFNSDDYKWILGIKVICDLDMMHHYSYCTENIGEPKTLFGIKVDIDYQNPYNVQLWENITNKL